MRGGGGISASAAGAWGGSGTRGGAGPQPLLPGWLQQNIRLLPLRPQAESKAGEGAGLVAGLWEQAVMETLFCLC